MTRVLRGLGMLLLLSATTARADDLPLDEVLRRAQKMMAERDTPLVCNMKLDTEVRDKSGKLDDSEQREAVMTAVHDKQDIHTTRLWRNGKELTGKELVEEQKKEDKAKEKVDDFQMNLAPLDRRNFSQQTFALDHMEDLWGHHVYVIKVGAAKPGRDIAAGTLWIDAKDFYEIKGVLEPTKSPKFTDSMHMQEQYTLNPQGLVVPTAMFINGRAGFLFVHKTFHVKMSWSDCR